MKSPKKTKAHTSPNREESKMVNLIDQVAEFESFKRDLLPKLRDAIKQNKSTKEITEMARAIATARIASIAAWDSDNRTALSAAKELLDRAEGKSTEKREVTHRMANLKDEDLDAVLITALSDAEEDGSDDK